MSTVAETRSRSFWWPRFSRDPSGREWQLVRNVLSRSAELELLPDGGLTRAAIQLREKATPLTDGLDAETVTEGCALAREAIRRTTGRSLYPVQVLAGMILARGSVAEMQTGEGKTLTSALPGFLGALRFPSVHVATPNAYLAERDCQELRPAYEMLGLRVALLPEKPDPAKTRAAYQADVTYGTGYEFGFDFLRDQLALRQRPSLSLGAETLLSLRGESLSEVQTAQTGHACALIDEIDSVLLDEAMTPLIISLPSQESPSGNLLYRVALLCSERLVRGEHFQLDQATHSTQLSTEGVRQAFAWLAAPKDLGLPACATLVNDLKRPWIQYVEQALHARFFLRRDIDYVVRQDKVEIVDQKTGRIFSERSWRAGLHQAVEMREGVPLTSEKVSAARITRQRYFQLYRVLAGMTGTATGAETEFRELYKLNVAVIPLNKPSLRQNLPDRFFASIDAKFEAAVRETDDCHRRGQPVLIGTRTIVDSERLSGLLQSQKIPHLVLNGKQDQDEAEIVSHAGAWGQVTIATNMAGRGTDIKPGARALQAGGLHVLGLERYESRRIDRQLAGRSARAGAPGSARFLISADDELLRDHAPALARRLRASAGADGECRSDFSSEIVSLQTHREMAGFQSRKAMIHQDRWLEEVIDSLCRKEAK